MHAYRCLTCILFCVTGSAAEPSAAPLRGLRAFHIVVEPIDVEAQAAGLTADWLRKDAELRLQGGGIGLADQAAKPEQATLSIAVAAAKGTSDYAFHITVRVLQNARLVRAPDVALPMVSTWELEYLDNVGPPPAKMPGWVRPILANMMDRLVQDFRKVNPTPPAR